MIRMWAGYEPPKGSPVSSMVWNGIQKVVRISFLAKVYLALKDGGMDDVLDGWCLIWDLHGFCLVDLCLSTPSTPILIPRNNTAPRYCLFPLLEADE